MTNKLSQITKNMTIGAIIIVLFLFPSPLFSQLLQTQWNNSCYYNYYQPVDSAGPCYKCYVSSTSVAMGQLMKYWQHPNKGWGYNGYSAYIYGWQYANFEHDYAWGSMPNSISSNNFDLARLLTDCEISTSTNYSPYFYNYSCGLVNLDTVRLALRDHFGYKNGLVIHKNTKPQFKSLIINEINHGRPVIMEIYPYNNQCSKFCTVDGYNPANQKFHINWGNGSYWNMWSRLDTISYSYTLWGLNQSALIGVEPDTMLVTIDIKYDLTPNPISAHVVINGLDYDATSGTVTVELKKNWYSPIAYTNEPWGNSNSLDALIIMRHFTGMITLSGLKLICANVSGDNTINSVDALFVSKRFVQLINSFPVGDWKFSIPDVNTPGIYTIYGRCTGDVN